MAERYHAVLRGRVKRVRAVIATTPGLEKILASDRRRAAMFNTRFEVTWEWLRHGVPAYEGMRLEEREDRLTAPVDHLPELRARGVAVGPGNTQTGVSEIGASPAGGRRRPQLQKASGSSPTLAAHSVSATGGVGDIPQGEGLSTAGRRGVRMFPWTAQSR
jgi:hypothetical protein